MDKQKALREILKETENIKEPVVKEKIDNLVNELLTKTPLETDKWIYRSVVWALGIAIILCLLFTFSVVRLNFRIDSGTIAEIPDIFLAIASAAVGALAGLLAPSPVRSGNP